MRFSLSFFLSQSCGYRIVLPYAIFESQLNCFESKHFLVLSFACLKTTAWLHTVSNCLLFLDHLIACIGYRTSFIVRTVALSILYCTALCSHRRYCTSTVFAFNVFSFQLHLIGRMFWSNSSFYSTQSGTVNNGLCLCSHSAAFRTVLQRNATTQYTAFSTCCRAVEIMNARSGPE